MSPLPSIEDSTLSELKQLRSQLKESDAKNKSRGRNYVKRTPVPRLDASATRSRRKIAKLEIALEKAKLKARRR